MGSRDKLLDEKVLRQLVTDIGLENTRRFMESLDNEYQKRIGNIGKALEDRSLEGLAAEAHALKSSAQVSGACKLADVLIDLEVNAKLGRDEAFALAEQALTLAELTRFAYVDLKLNNQPDPK